MVTVNPAYQAPIPGASIDPGTAPAAQTPAGAAAASASESLPPQATQENTVEQRASRLGSTGLKSSGKGTDPAGAEKELESLNEQAFDFYTISSVFMMLAIAMRKLQRDQKQAALMGQVKELLTGVADAREAAEKRFTAAMIQTVMQGVAGVVQGGFAGISLRMAYKMQLSPATNPNTRRFIEPESDFAALNQQLGSKAQGFAGMGQASSQLLSSSGGFAAAFWERAAGMKDADARESDAHAKMAEAAVQQASDAMNDAKEAFTKVLELVADMARTNTEGTKAVARNI